MEFKTTQSKYIHKLLVNFNMKNSKPKSTPMDEGFPLESGNVPIVLN